MPRWQMTLEDFERFANQLDDDSALMFGSRAWEKYITESQPELWTEMAADCLGDHNREMRRLLTLVYAPAYQFSNERLPQLSIDLLGNLKIQYPDSSFCELAGARLNELLIGCDPLWAEVVRDYFERSSLSLEHLYRTYLYALLLLEALAYDQDFGDSTQVPEPRKPAKGVKPSTPQEQPQQASSDNRHAMPTIEPVKDNPVSFKDIGGYDDIKTQLQDLAQMFKHPGVMARWGAEVPRGVLLNGPAGVGKTYWAYALAHETGRPFFDLKRNQITSPYVNESARWIEGVFDQVKQAGGAIIFLDEADGLVFSRGRSNISGEDHKVVTALNKCLQRPPVPDGILIIMATNRKDLMDEATIRAQRIDLVIDFRSPNADDRRGVFNVHCNRIEATAGRQIFHRDLSPRIISDMEGFSCADIAEIVQRIIRSRAKRELAGESDSLITSEDFLATISQYRSERFAKKKPHIGFGR